MISETDLIYFIITITGVWILTFVIEQVTKRSRRASKQAVKKKDKG